LNFKDEENILLFYRQWQKGICKGQKYSLFPPFSTEIFFTKRPCKTTYEIQNRKYNSIILLFLTVLSLEKKAIENIQIFCSPSGNIVLMFLKKTKTAHW